MHTALAFKVSSLVLLVRWHCQPFLCAKFSQSLFNCTHEPQRFDKTTALGEEFCKCKRSELRMTELDKEIVDLRLICFP